MVKAVISSPVRVHVADHSFGVFDHYEIPIETADWSTGLVVAMSSGAMIYTGIDRGYVNVTIDVAATAPDAIDSGPWDDIVEASVVAPHGHLCVECLEYSASGTAPDLPLLSPQGPGSYRLRAHARGRDLHYDAVQNEPSEDYLLTIWPAQPAPHLIIRATDQCGYGLRLSDTQRQRTSTTHALPPEQNSRNQRQALLRQALLDGPTTSRRDGQPSS